MDQERIRSIIETLANGVDPITGEVLPNCSPYNHPEVIRALFHTSRMINLRHKPKKTLQERQRENQEKGLPRNYGLPWKPEDVDSVIQQYNSNIPIQEIASQQERKPSSIVNLLQKHEIISEQQAIFLSQK